MISKSKNTELFIGDCDVLLESVQNKIVQTVCIDPPYNIGKDSWDHWDSTEDYVRFMTNIINKIIPKMKDNGSFFMFHNDMEQISELMVSIKKNTSLKFMQMIVWNKRFEGSPRKGFMDGFVVKNDLHNWNKMAEYILYYTFDNTYKFKEARIANKISQLTISKEIPSKAGNLTGWYSNIETGKNMPTRETMKPITKHLLLDYNDIVPKYKNLKKDHSVWNYDISKKSNGHLTPKPVALIENIILHTTDEGDCVLDCFAGTGSLGIACEKNNRKCILIEKNKDYLKNFIKEYYSVHNTE